jgi:60 kDa SS-A/Ro ribonucleoprotein
MGKTYYVKQKGLIDGSEDVHNEMVASDPEFAAKALVYARNKGYMRTQPTMGLAKLVAFKGASSEVAHRRGLSQGIFDRVLRTPADLLDWLVMAQSFGASVNGRRIKGMVNGWLDRKFSEYWAIKYGSARRGDWSVRRVLRHFHPRHKELWRYLRRTRGDNAFEVNLEGLPQLAAFEALKGAQTDAERVRLITEGRLPHEVATSFAGSSRVVWDAIVPQLPIFALLKNLATLERHGVLDANRELIEGKFTDAQTVQRSRILPFRFLKAAEMVQSPWAADALREALELSFENIPAVEGRTGVFLDISGSMSGQFLRVASIFAICLMKKARLNGRLLLFDHRLQELRVSMRDSILTQASRIHPQGGTNTALPMQYLLQQEEKVDNIILITDEQQNTGRPFYDVLSEYRRRVQPKVKTFIVDVSPYHTPLAEPNDPSCMWIYGWSDQVLNMISLSSQGWGSMVEAIRATED